MALGSRETAAGAAVDIVILVVALLAARWQLIPQMALVGVISAMAGARVTMYRADKTKPPGSATAALALGLFALGWAMYGGGTQKA